MEVKAIRKYNDLLLGRLVRVGEVLEVADARATELIKARVAEAVEPVAADKAAKGRKKVTKGE